MLVVSLEPFDTEQAALLKAFRDDAAEKTGVRMPDHDTYRYHITLAYKLMELDQREQESISERSRASGELLKRMQDVELGSPELCFFKDMSAFLPNVKR